VAGEKPVAAYFRAHSDVPLEGVSSNPLGIAEQKRKVEL
jgi:hypothetical protein